MTDFDTRPFAPRPYRPYRRATVYLILALTGLVMALWLLGTPGGVLGKADAVGYAICHRIADRSFVVDGRPLPLCARCTGIYLGVMTGLFIILASGRSRASRLPPIRVLVLFGVFVAILGVDGVNSYLHLLPGFAGGLYEPQNWLRLITGSLAGIVMINFLYPVFSGVVWAQPEDTPALRSLKELAGVLLVVGLIDVLVLAQIPAVLLVFGLISAAGPPVILIIVGMVLFISLTHRENTVVSWRQLAIPVLVGVIGTFIGLGAIDAVRFAFTGTWEGFNFSTLVGG